MRTMIYGLLALAPLPFASARPSWQWLWVAVVGALVFLYVIKNWHHRGRKVPRSLSLAFWLGGLFVAWGFAQISSLFDGSLGVSIKAVDQLIADLGSISVAPHKTISNATFFLSHGAFFWLVFAYCDRRIRSVQLLRFCGIVVALYAVYGFIIFVSGNESVLWYKKWASFGSLTSTFVNRNSFAAFAGLGLQCLIAYAYYWLQDELMEGRTGRELYRHVIETVIARAWWLPLGIVLTAIAILLTNSRGGFGSVAIAVFLLILLSSSSYQRVRSVFRRFFGSVTVLAMVVGLFALSGEMLESRLQMDTTFDQRFIVYPLVVEAIMDRPLTGFGLGTFDDVFRIYRDQNVTIYFDRAHNDYLELAVTAGIPAAAMLVLAFVNFVAFLIGRLKFGAQHRAFIALGITSSIQLGLHSLVDFPLQIPAISYMWCAILAASVALAHRCEKASGIPSEIHRRD